MKKLFSFFLVVGFCLLFAANVKASVLSEFTDFLASLFAISTVSSCKAAPSQPTLTSPSDGSTITSLTPRLSWNGPTSWGGSDCTETSRQYAVEIDTSKSILANSPSYHRYWVDASKEYFDVPAGVFEPGQTFYWRVYARNQKGAGPYSAVFQFKTQVAAYVEGSISANPQSGVESLSDVDFTLTVGGTASGLVNYKLDCTSDGSWDYIFTGASETTKTISDACDYPKVGSYKAKFVIERGGLTADGSIDIVVSAKSEPKVNNAPKVNAGSDIETSESSVKLNATASDSDGDPLTYYWNCSSQAKISNREILNPTIDVSAFSEGADVLCTITVYDSKGGQASDSLVIRLQKKIKVMRPGGETLTKGEKAEITWSASGSEKVNIVLLDGRGGWSYIVIARDISISAGTYSWSVPTEGFLSGTTNPFKIWIGTYDPPKEEGDWEPLKETANETLYGESAGFSIKDPDSYLSVTLKASPESGYAPLSVDLEAAISTNLSGPFTYQFDCNSDNSWEYTFEGVAVKTKKVTNACKYEKAGSYYPLVRVINEPTGQYSKYTSLVSVNEKPIEKGSLTFLNTSEDQMLIVPGDKGVHISFNTIVTGEKIIEGKAKKVEICKAIDQSDLCKAIRNEYITNIYFMISTMGLSKDGAGWSNGKIIKENGKWYFDFWGAKFWKGSDTEVWFWFDVSEDISMSKISFELFAKDFPFEFVGSDSGEKIVPQGKISSWITVGEKSFLILSALREKETISEETESSILFVINLRTIGDKMLLHENRAEICKESDKSDSCRIIRNKEITNIRLLKGKPPGGSASVDKAGAPEIGKVVQEGDKWYFDFYGTILEKNADNYFFFVGDTGKDLSLSVINVFLDASNFPYEIHTESDIPPVKEGEISVQISVRGKNHSPTVRVDEKKITKYAGEWFPLYATASDPDNDPLTYLWKCNVGTLYYKDSLTAYLVTDDAVTGDFFCSITVTDDEGLTASDSLSIKLLKPELGIDLVAKPTSGDAPLNDVDFELHIKSTITGTFAFGIDCTNDGTWEYTQRDVTPGIISIPDLCDYPEPGEYQARALVVSDEIWFDKSDKVTISVKESNSAACVNLVDNGDKSKKLDIVFVPDNISEDSLDDFQSKINNHVDALLSVEPFKSGENKINFYFLKTNKNFGFRKESGLDVRWRNMYEPNVEI